MTLPARDRERGLHPRERGDDVEVTVRLRRSAWVELTGDGLRVDGRMQLVNDGDAYTMVVWAAEMPTWPEPVPGNDTARTEAAQWPGSPPATTEPPHPHHDPHNASLPEPGADGDA